MVIHLGRDTCEWRIHIGAHKTATTHVQDVMEACRPQLQSKVVEYIPRDTMRARIRKVMPKKPMRFMLRNWFRQLMLEHRLASGYQAAKSIVFSEEVIIGNKLTDLFAETTYPNIEDRLGIIRRLLRKNSVKLFLSIRSFDRVLPGAYATELIRNPSAPAILQRFLTFLDAKPPSWVAVIERVLAAAPGAELRVWRQEDYRDKPQDILSEFAGVTIDRMPELPPPPSTVTPSDDAIRMVESLIESEGGIPHDYTNRVVEIYASYPASNQSNRYTFLTPAQAERLKQLYEEDLANIRRRWPEMLIDA